jgi:hypothetical protein
MATPVLILHIAAGVIGRLSGMAARLLRKGSDGHRMAGKLFVIFPPRTGIKNIGVRALRTPWNRVTCA